MPRKKENSFTEVLDRAALLSPFRAELRRRYAAFFCTALASLFVLAPTTATAQTCHASSQRCPLLLRLVVV